jgi:hypothetical protein
MKVTLPPIDPAVAGSTGLVTGAAGADPAGFSPPPQAAAASATVRVSARGIEQILMQAPLLVDNRSIIPFPRMAPPDRPGLKTQPHVRAHCQLRLAVRRR